MLGRYVQSVDSLLSSLPTFITGQLSTTHEFPGFLHTAVPSLDALKDCLMLDLGIAWT